MNQINSIGKSLKVSELKTYEFYWCQLSNRVVIVTSNIQKNGKTQEGDKFDYNTVSIQAWNEVTGFYDHSIVYDKQLAEIITEE